MSRPAADVSRSAGRSDAAQPLAAKPGTAGQLLTALIENNLLPDACRLMAFAMPKRESVRWACCCIRDSKAAGNGIAAVDAAEKWLATQAEVHRRAAQKASETVGVSTPAGCAALAAFLSGGSLAPPNVAEVAPGDNLTPSAVSGAVMLAAVTGDPTKADELYRKFLALGNDVAGGKNKWKS